jgi:hypothetical protein
VSTSPYRTNPKPLAGAVVSGPIYVFSSPDTGVTGARFYLDDPTMSGMPRQTEKSPPFDFAGGNVSVANAFDTGKISAGSHTITAALRLASGATAVVSATFSVQPKTLALSSTPNGSATLLLRSQADRSSPRALAGTTVARDIFVFLGSVSAQRVRFYVDDPGCRARPSRRNCALRSIWPGEPPRRPRPSTIADGAHTVTAAVDLSHGRHRGGERQRHGLQRPRHDQVPGPQDEIAASATRLFMRIAVKHGASRGFLLCQ